MPACEAKSLARVVKSEVVTKMPLTALSPVIDVILNGYGAGVPERQARLNRVLRKAFAEKPKPKIVAIRRSLAKSSV
jgi:hypothetical protein